MNRIIIKGRICNDLDLSVANSGKEYLNVSVAVNRRFNRDETDFFNCVAFGKTAVFIDTYFIKGQEILIEGEMQQERWQDKDGNNRTGWKLIIANVEFCGGKSAETKQTDDLPYVPDDEDKPW